MHNSIGLDDPGSPALLPLEDALRPYRGVTVRMGRGQIKAGRLPAVKIGRCYYVDPADLAALFAPTLRIVPGGITRGESETARIDRQLAAGGVARRA